ncbi:unnamed protein product [Chondrus crispus]|uniref:RRM domain-containing protein n=1 Tax=Chondrus crispus TaxID=2769 RepID=R7QCZ3_CHOCR|nr:unnamed protein product [Chondrus crispus]CDF35934.1 unnamed protein product [Chondrus crispus]|eukprot:XP_005715753.1 unnamed protein product [Chondrus crispus]
MSVDEDPDLDAEFAQFEAQLQTVVSKPQPSVLPSSAPVPTGDNVTARSNRNAATRTSPATTTHSHVPATSPTPVLATNNKTAPLTGKWKWDGANAKWNWVTYEPTSSTTTPRPAPAAFPSRPVPSHATAYPYSNPSLHMSAPPTAVPSKKAAALVKRTAAGDVWQDHSLAEWPENDHRIFVGDLAPDATNEELVMAFSAYPSFNMARVVQDKRSGQCKGYGFVSFAAGEDMIAALREMNGKYVGSRPVKLKKSNWQKRNLDGARRKELKLFNTIRKKRR